MSAKFLCRMPDYDGVDDWTEVSSYDAQNAAEEYSEQCDSDSAMERFEDSAEPIVIVKDAAGVERKFKCSRDYNPVYFAAELNPKPEPACDIPI